MIYLFLFYLLFAIILYFTARKRGREPIFWAGLGFFFGPLAFLFLLLSNDTKGNKKLLKRSGKRTA
jgi:hypothetical protein